MKNNIVTAKANEVIEGHVISIILPKTKAMGINDRINIVKRYSM